MNDSSSQRSFIMGSGSRSPVAESVLKVGECEGRDTEATGGYFLGLCA